MSNVIQFNRIERMSKEEVEKRREILDKMSEKMKEQAKRTAHNEWVLKLARIKREPIKSDEEVL
jgi:hypothetical protein